MGWCHLGKLVFCQACTRSQPSREGTPRLNKALHSAAAAQCKRGREAPDAHRVTKGCEMAAMRSPVVKTISRGLQSSRIQKCYYATFVPNCKFWPILKLAVMLTNCKEQAQTWRIRALIPSRKRLTVCRDLSHKQQRTGA